LWIADWRIPESAIRNPFFLQPFPPLSRLRIMKTLLLFLSILLAQIRPSFEVVSIKPYEAPHIDTPRFIGFRPQATGRLTATGVTLKGLLTYGYRMHDNQIVGGPPWINTERYEVNAKAEDGTVVTVGVPSDPNVPDTMGLLVQSMIDDRFQLKMHRETREMSVYVLEIAKGGLKMKRSPDQTPPKPLAPGDGPPPLQSQNRGALGMESRPEGFIMRGTAVTISQIVGMLSRQSGRYVIDKTGLSGLFDVRLAWSSQILPTGAPDPVGPVLFIAVQEQLGLRLVSTTGPVPVIVVDGAQKPRVD
jgi:uncharacterized protein (TIGR03435 family)